MTLRSPSDLFGTFEEKGYFFEAWMPASDAESCEFRLQVKANGGLLLDIPVPMAYRPIFGPDLGDVAELQAITERLVAALPPFEALDALRLAEIKTEFETQTA